MNKIDLDDFQTRFHNRFLFKKRCNAYISLIIAIFGMAAVAYSVFVFKSNLIDRLRYMTFCGTIYTSIISLIFFFVCIHEADKNTEVTSRTVYFMRLSAASTEFIIFFVVMVGLLPSLPDKPDISSYPGIMMHLVIPALMLLSFIFNDAPIGKLKPLEPFLGTSFITIYAIIMGVLFGSGILPSDLAPYSFFDFKHHSFLFPLTAAAFIYTAGYNISLFLSILNMKLSWIWFSDIKSEIANEAIENRDNKQSETDQIKNDIISK